MLSASSKAKGLVLAVSSGFVNEVLVRFGFFKVFRCDAFGQYVNPGQVRQMPSHRTDTRQSSLHPASPFEAAVPIEQVGDAYFQREQCLNQVISKTQYV